MIDKATSFIGNSYRFNNSLKKDSIHAVFLGASVTCGYTDKGNVEDTFYKLFCDSFEKNFGIKATSEYVGFSGTSSLFGIYYTKSYIENVDADIVFVDYAVNNDRSMSGISEFESLVRLLMNTKSKPTVIPICVRTADDYSCEDYMLEISKHYGLSCITLATAVSFGIENNIIDWGRYSPDGVHPGQWGHSFINDCIISSLLKMKDTFSDNFEIKEPLFSDAYKNAHFPKENITLQGFLYTSDYNYIENDVSDLNTPHSIFIKGNFSKVFGIYEIFHGDEYGACDVILNGEHINVINSKSIFGWMTPKDIRIIDLSESSYNELELRITKSSAKRIFKIKLMIS